METRDPLPPPVSSRTSSQQLRCGLDDTADGRRPRTEVHRVEFLLHVANRVHCCYQMPFGDVANTNREVTCQLATLVTPPDCYPSIVRVQDERRTTLPAKEAMRHSGSRSRPHGGAPAGRGRPLQRGSCRSPGRTAAAGPHATASVDTRRCSLLAQCAFSSENRICFSSGGFFLFPSHPRDLSVQVEMVTQAWCTRVLGAASTESHSGGFHV